MAHAPPERKPRRDGWGFRYRKLGVDEFMDLMKRSTFAINDFLFVTGRHGAQVMAFIRSREVDNGTANLPYSPKISDIILMELAARYPQLANEMVDIASEYALPDEEKEKADRYW